LGVGEKGWDIVDWINVAQDRDQWKVIANTVINIRLPYHFGKFLSSCATGGFSRRAEFRGVKSPCDSSVV
jgi:hypothetical protein